MIKTSNTKYVILKTFTHFREPAIPLKAENGKLLCLAFMCAGDKRLVLVERQDIFS